jgi:hypothetical protein
MENLQPTLTNAQPPRRWPLFLLGFLLIVLEPVLYVIQFSLQRIDVMPWYLPGLTSAGILLMAASAWQRRGILRIGGLILFLVVCGLQWFFFVVVAKTPVYTGPAQVGKKLPAFATTLADGVSFTERDLESGSSTVMLFYRGHW